MNNRNVYTKMDYGGIKYYEFRIHKKTANS